MGLLERQQELAALMALSLEEAHERWKKGQMRTLLALQAATICRCQCGNSDGLNCMTSAHAEMRETMRSGVIPDHDTLHTGIISQG